ncbi:MAG: VacJ family lipoprotein [Nitrospinota bacterium]|nr:VacJ family lipoprotein [Nitrospinota bacterium]
MKRYGKKILIIQLLIIPLLFSSIPPSMGAEFPDWVWHPEIGRNKDPLEGLDKETETDKDPFGNFDKFETDGAEGEETPKDPFDTFDEFEGESYNGQDTAKGATIYDPLEPINRVIFTFNDKLYFWVLKPTAKGYAYIVPERGRLGVKRFFSNLGFPVRFVNSALQLKPKSAGIELSRFAINTTVGLLGFMDPAEKMGFEKQDEDFGQTLGHYGLGHGIYITLPIVGPSSLRDMAGLTGDYYLEPETYFYRDNPETRTVLKTFRVVNDTSLNIDRYEKFVKDAFDPYTFVKDAYAQRRKKQVEE